MQHSMCREMREDEVGEEEEGNCEEEEEGGKEEEEEDTGMRSAAGSLN